MSRSGESTYTHNDADVSLCVSSPAILRQRCCQLTRLWLIIPLLRERFTGLESALSAATNDSEFPRIPPFQIGADYSRKQIRAAAGDRAEKGGPWDTGYHLHHGVFYIFSNIGTSGRTGHNYGNVWLSDDELRWYGKTNSHANQPMITRMVGGVDPVLLFYRSNNSKRWTFAGLVQALYVDPISRPVLVQWKVLSELLVAAAPRPTHGPLIEGAVRTAFVNVYERNRDAREECIRHYGLRCTVCNFDFEAVYGAIGKGYIHVHHLVSLSKRQGEYMVNPKKDLRPVCANCHSMLHRQVPALDPDALREMLKIPRF